MIGSLQGFPVWQSGVDVCLQVGGVGYVVKMTESARKLVDDDKEILVYVHHHVREDAETLYGFASLQERGLFGWLIGLQGVGPSLAFAVLGALTPSQLFEVANSDDVELMCSVPGVGRKTGERIVMEMRNKSKIFTELGITAATENDNGKGETDTGELVDGVRSEVIEALCGLGYTKAEATSMLRDAPPFEHANEGLRWALQHTHR